MKLLYGKNFVAIIDEEGEEVFSSDNIFEILLYLKIYKPVITQVVYA